MRAPGLRIALAQLDPTVGDLAGNSCLIAEAAKRARAAGADLLVTPELCLPGYPAEDLYLKRHFADANRRALDELAATIEGIVVTVGFAEPGPRLPRPSLDAPGPPAAHNSLAVIEAGEVRAVYRKNRLPNYGVFDEARYFQPGSGPMTYTVAGVEIGLTICEDVWVEGPPASLEAEAGVRLIVNPSGSPYLRGKGRWREQMFAARARAYGAAFAFCNLVGGQDELVFDGHSFFVDAGGALVARARQFEPDMILWELGAEARVSPAPRQPLDELPELYAALRLGLSDYVEKNGFERVLVALSGGIDSALVAQLAVDAVGPERVSMVIMPSPHSSEETQADARTIARNLGAEAIELPIGEPMRAYDELLDPVRADIGSDAADADAQAESGDPTSKGGEQRDSSPAADLAQENIQARIRGNLVMALSNRTGWLVLTTGNKSEMSVGYATLYGDMAGGFAVIKDVPKTLVYRLVEHRNALAGSDLVPRAVIERPPSAELRPDQLDSDSLPDYELLDRILEAYVERDLSRDQIVDAETPSAIVDEVIRLVDRSEYKRRQAPPGIRVSGKAFGRDRRLPITNRFGG